jgi:7-cyano-7-deazaguanine synthase in queuosine biosynthesis
MHGATEQHIKMFARLMYEKKYDEARTLHEWNNIDPTKTWRCEVLKAKLPSYIDSVQCGQCTQRRKSYEEPGAQGKAANIITGLTTENHCGSCRNKPCPRKRHVAELAKWKSLALG